MANALFDVYKEAMLGGGSEGGTLVDLDTDTIHVVLIDTGQDDPDVAVDEYLVDLSPDPVVDTAETLGTVTLTNGTFDADDATFALVSGASVEELLIYKWTGSSATSVLIVSFDTATGLPVSPNGGDIVVQWNGSGIFSL